MSRWISPDGRFAATMSPAVWTAIDAHIREAHPNETGGVLAGVYDDALAVAAITAATGPPPDSRAGRTWFQRGKRHLARWLGALWSKPTREYYLGEWHYHPADHVEPSPDDMAEMESIAASPNYNCPEPLMFIFGKGRGARRIVRVFVHPHAAAAIELVASPAIAATEHAPAGGPRL